MSMLCLTCFLLPLSSPLQRELLSSLLSLPNFPTFPPQFLIQCDHLIVEYLSLLKWDFKTWRTNCFISKIKPNLSPLSVNSTFCLQLYPHHVEQCLTHGGHFSTYLVNHWILFLKNLKLVTAQWPSCYRNHSLSRETITRFQMGLRSLSEAQHSRSGKSLSSSIFSLFTIISLMQLYAGCERKTDRVAIPVVKHSMTLSNVCIISCISTYCNSNRQPKNEWSTAPNNKGSEPEAYTEQSSSTRCVTHAD